MIDAVRSRLGLRSGLGASALLTLAAQTSLAACAPESRPATQVAVRWEVIPSPPVEGPVRIEFTLADGHGGTLSDADVEVEAGMNHAGMVPELAQATDLGQGRYAAELELSMGGDWFLIFRGTLGDGTGFEEIEDLKGVAAR